MAAIKAAKAGDTVVVSAGTFTAAGGIDVPDGVTIIGQGKDASWIKGQIRYGSNTVVKNLKMGDVGRSAAKNRNGARNTTFEDCRFRGGGGSAWNYVLLLGEGASCSFITFRNCEVECNLGSENASLSNGFNDVTIWVGGSTSVSDILFEGCHIGVSNGVRSGAPRMGVECYTDDGAQYGWQRITFRSCVVEVCDAHGMDFSDEQNVRSQGLVVEGCHLKGAGLRPNAPWASTIDLEYPLRATIRNNTFGLGQERCVQMTTRGDAYSPAYAVFQGNRIDLTPNGVTKADYWTAVDVTSCSPWGSSNTTVN